MIKAENIFDDIEHMTAMWVDEVDAGELARIASVAIDNNVPFVSMPCSCTKTFWPWVEETDVKILNRLTFHLEKNQSLDNAVSEFATNVNAAFRLGAHGIQVLVPLTEIHQFTDAILPIKNDLFFDRYVSVGIDIDDASCPDWSDIFGKLQQINPNSVLVMGHVDKFNPKSDFVGQIYAMLENWDLNTDLHLMFGKNMLRVSQVLRLTQKMKPKLMKNIRVFISK